MLNIPKLLQISFIATFLTSVFLTFYGSLPTYYIAIICSLTFLIFSLLSKNKNFICPLVLFVMLMPIYDILPFLQGSLASPLIITLLIAVPFYRKKIFSLIKLGNIKGHKIWIAILIISAFSSIALILWGIWSNALGPVADNVSVFKNHSWILLLVVIPLMATLNAIVEETVFRGILQTELNYMFGNYMAIIFQAILFAGAHYAGGFPNGKTGFVMTFIYAILLGVMRFKTKGLLAPIITHVIADSTIFVFVLYFVA